MGAVTESQHEKRLGIVILLAGLLAGLIVRFYLGSFAQMPGHGDSAFYFSVAKNIAEGRGPVVDYIVYFFNGLLPLPHYAGDFWNPTAAYLIAIPMLLFGRTISAALIAPILAGVVPAISGFLAGRRYTGSTVLGALTGLLTFFSAFQVWFSVTTEAIIFAGAFGSVAIYFMMNHEGSGPYFLVAALFTGLANLVRQDNILLLVTLEICVLMATLPWKRKLLVAVAAIVIHLMALSPLLVLNEVHLGTPFPAGPAKTAFLTTYEDFHSYNKTIDWTTLRATFGIRGIITRRLHTGAENLGQVDYFLTPLLVILVLAALLDAILLRRDSARLWLLFPPAIFAVLQYAFYTVVASLSGPGSLIKSLGSLMPFISMAIVGLFARYSRSRIALIVTVALVAAFSAYQGFTKNLQSTTYYNGVYDEYRSIRAIVLSDAAHRGAAAASPVIMARDTWDVFEGTGFPTVMVPNNEIDTILFVARYYNAHYILLPAKRPQLDKIYTGVTPDPRFQLIAEVPGSDVKIYWLAFSH